MTRTILALLILCGTIGTPGGSLVTADDGSKTGDSPVARLLAAMPAKSAAEQHEASARLVELGPAAVAEVCGKLVQPGTGDDTQARYALDGLSTYVHRPGAERERLVVAGGYIQALENAESLDVRAFLIQQLERVGREESLAALAEYLTDPRLGEPAARALVSIGTPGVPRRLLRALPLVEGTRTVTIINALGTLRADAASRELLPYARSESAPIRQAALTALADIGPPAAEPLLAEAARAESDAARGRGSALYLRYAKRLGECGRAEDCVRICRELIKARQLPGESHVACAALSTLAGSLGSEAGEDVLAAMKSEYPDVRGVALRLALSIPGKDFTARCVDLMRTWTPEARAGILEMLGRRGDASALPAVREALAASLSGIQLDVQFAAIQAIGRLTDRPALTVLLEEISRGGLAEWRLIPFLEWFGGEQALRAVVDKTESEDRTIQGTALETLIDWPEPNALEPLLAAFRSVEDRMLRDLILGAYMRLVAASGRSQEAVLELYRDALAAARHPGEKKRVLEGLGRLRFRPSLELVETFFGDDDLKEAAAAAAVSIIRPRREGRGGLRGTRVEATLEKVIAMTGNDDLRREAQDILKALESRSN